MAVAVAVAATAVLVPLGVAAGAVAVGVDGWGEAVNVAEGVAVAGRGIILTGVCGTAVPVPRKSV